MRAGGGGGGTRHGSGVHRVDVVRRASRAHTDTHTRARARTRGACISHARAGIGTMLQIGTAGFSYAHWRGRFYPSHLAACEHLRFYFSQFGCVEINQTFHAFPRVGVLQAWRRQLPAHARVVLKACKVVTHVHGLTPPLSLLQSFFSIAYTGLDTHLAGVLFQFPASLRCNVAALRGFLDRLDRARAEIRADVRVALEFRAQDWFATRDVLELARQRDVALVQGVVVDDARFQQLRHTGLCAARGRLGDVRAEWDYVRFHGSKMEGVKTRFPQEVLRKMAAECVRKGKDAFVFFLNDLDAAATQDARCMAELVARERNVSVKRLLGFAPGWSKKKVGIEQFFVRGETQREGVREKKVQDATTGAKGMKSLDVKSCIRKTGGGARKRKARSIADYFSSDAGNANDAS